MDKHRVSAIIAAGGRGLRLGAEMPKQFINVCGMPLLAWSAIPFCQCERITEIVVTAPEDYIEMVWQIIHEFKLEKMASVVPGGATRQESVRNGINACKIPDVILTHDSVRPFVTIREIEAVIDGALEYGSCVTGVIPKDTIKAVDCKEIVTRTFDRSALRLIQTPQGFLADILKRAHEEAVLDGAFGTDDAWLVERLGLDVYIAKGSYENIKVTTKDDLMYCEWRLSRKI
ncbi:MAG: 2-C-methyl-D-erythritol 4-phosphate cytidylyltransferase [Clostridiales bacterium]|jgi:2-C-methyl-D-erythritol 4-phosphate cytidylyltransferase|nr:2-C-methyl-D-erythritol 4-phosphate cytidylyltransferase [Clostridiales bacterium]